jgi:hypothetical protein
VSRYSFRADLLALMLVVTSVSCGRNAGSAPGAGAHGGASDLGGAAGYGGAGGESPTTPPPSSVSVIVGGDGPLVDAHSTPTCINGFEGFASRVDGLSIDFEAFITEPGRYEGDPIRILYLDVKMPDGNEYCATAGQTTCPGTVTLIARSVEPRFTGEVEAELVNRNDATAPTLTVNLTFDIASHVGCK